MSADQSKVRKRGESIAPAVLLAVMGYGSWLLFQCLTSTEAELHYADNVTFRAHYFVFGPRIAHVDWHADSPYGLDTKECPLFVDDEGGSFWIRDLVPGKVGDLGGDVIDGQGLLTRPGYTLAFSWDDEAQMVVDARYFAEAGGTSTLEYR